MPTTGNDTLNGTTGNDTIDGLGGNDSIFGNSGNDSLIGNTGDDTLVGDAGNDTLRGGEGNDVLAGGAGNDLLDGGNGALDVISFAGGTPVSVDLVAQQSFGGAANGNDTLSGIEGVFGTAGNDTLIGDLGANLFTGLSGNDFISGSAGNDTIDGGNNADSLEGGDGDDSITGGSGNDTLNGGDDFDVLVYRGSTAVTLSLAAGFATHGADVDTFSFFEGAEGSSLSDALIGSAGSNRLFGDASDDTIDGNRATTGAGDTLDGGDGNDLLAFTNGGIAVSVSLAGGTATGVAQFVNFERVLGSQLNDTVFGGNGNDSVSGNGGDDILIGGQGNDTLFGANDNDNIRGDAGNDSLDGGSGIDTVGTFESSAPAIVNFTTGRITRGTEQDTIANFEAWIGGGGADQFIGGAGNDSANASNGNDVLNGLVGNDTLSGEVGDDEIIGGLGADSLNGGAGRDTVSYEDAIGAVTVNLATGLASGADGNDTLAAGTFEAILGSAFNDILTGDDFDNELRGLAGANSLSGGPGNDTLVIVDDVNPAFVDTVDGGIGTADLAVFSGSPVAFTVDLATGVAQSGGVTIALLSGIERVRNGSGTVSSLFGTGLDETLEGGSSGDRLEGRGGNDVLTGGGSTSLLFADRFVFGGNFGNDTITDFNPLQRTIISVSSVSSTTRFLDLDADGQADDTRIVAVGGTINLLNVSASSLVAGATGGGILVGGTGDDLIFDLSETAVAVTLIGSDGADTLIGGSGFGGARTLRGGAGADVLVGDMSTAVADYSQETGQVVIDLASGIANGAQSGFDRLIGMAGATGGAGADIMVGGAQRETLSGGDGDDWIDGGAGNDQLSGGAGSDTLIAGSSNEFDVLEGGAGSDFLFGGNGVRDLARVSDGSSAAIFYNMANGFSNQGNGANVDFIDQLVENVDTGAGNDTVIGWTQTLTVNLLAGDDSFLDFSPGANNRVLGGDGADILQPLAGNDTLEGQAGDDVLWAGDGDDRLIGGLGADNLLGGAGNDRFVFQSTADSTPLSFDVIGDFAAGDRIDLAQIDANTVGGTSNDAFTVVSAFDSAPGRLVLTNGGGFFVVQGDTNGDNVADFTLVVVATSLTAADFVL